MAVPLLVDVDAGTDDAVALMILIALASDLNFTIKAITCVNGNTDVDNVVRNVLLTLESMDRPDIPVYRGAESSLLNDLRASTDFHGGDGFGDKGLTPPKIRVQQENAIVAINRIAEENKGLVVISIGPLTNLALALKTYPNVKNNLGAVWIMGGNIHGVGNVPNTTAEFNFATDPEAAHIVLKELRGEITVLPWETTTKSSMTTEWRKKTLGSIYTKHMILLQLIEEDQLSKEFWNPCDGLLAAAFVNKNATLKSSKVDLNVELQGLYTRGQCVILNGEPRIRIIEELDFGVIQEVMTQMANYRIE